MFRWHVGHHYSYRGPHSTLQTENSVKYIVKVEPSPLEAVLSMTAMRLCLGLSAVSDEVVAPAPAERVLDEEMLGLALKRDEADPLGAFRVHLLVQGTHADANRANKRASSSKRVVKRWPGWHIDIEWQV